MFYMRRSNESLSIYFSHPFLYNIRSFLFIAKLTECSFDQFMDTSLAHKLSISTITRNLHESSSQISLEPDIMLSFFWMSLFFQVFHCRQLRIFSSLRKEPL